MAPRSPDHCAKLAAAQRGRRHSPETIARMRETRAGRRLSAEHRANIAAALSGRPKSAEACEKMSAAKRGKPSHEWTKAQRSAAALRRRGSRWSDEQRAKLTGRNSPHWGKSPAHRARVRYKDISFRSSWEVRVAQFLDGRNIAWEYEAHRFDLGECTYLPDFYLPELGCYWEVKGWLNDDSRRKAALFRSMHPETPLVIVTEAVLQLLEK